MAICLSLFINWFGFWISPDLKAKARVDVNRIRSVHHAYEIGLIYIIYCYYPLGFGVDMKKFINIFISLVFL